MIINMKKWKVVSTAVTFGKFHKEPVKRLEEIGCEVMINPFGRPFTTEEMIKYGKDADALIVGNDKVVKEEIDQCKKLKIIAKHGVGVDGIDIKAAHDRGIIVTNAPGTNCQEVADCAMGFILMLARDYYRAVFETKSGKWIKRPGISLYQKTIGILGLGNIGTAMAKRAAGFDMDILGYDIKERQEVRDLGVKYVSLEELLSNSDFITLHLPLNDGTRNLIDSEKFKMMKKGTILVNTARSQIVNSEALYKALQDGTLLGYATDVYDSEPPVRQPFFDLPNVLLTPHEAGTTFDSNKRMGNTAVDNVIAVLTGKEPPFIITGK